MNTQFTCRECGAIVQVPDAVVLTPEQLEALKVGGSWVWHWARYVGMYNSAKCLYCKGAMDINQALQNAGYEVVPND